MINRRQFLHLAAGGAAGLATGGLGSLLNLQSAAARTKPDPKFVPDLDIALKATPGEVQILPGNPTSVWHYQGQLLKGQVANLIHLEPSYLGPIIRVHRGQKIRIRFTNKIPAETIVHWHGLHVPALMDGHPRLVIPRGETYIYEFEVRNRAGTYWYHPHPHGRTGHQVYGGMAGFPVLRVKVNRREKAGQILPQRLSTVERYRTEEAVNQGYPKIFELLMRHMAWTINGRTFQMKAVAPDEKVKMNSMEIWEFVNRSGGMGMMGMMQMPHPIHLHGKQFQVLERQGVMHEGYVDEGWKDTVLLMPGERIRILVRFGDYPGLFLYHCHNLEHEDMGMMRNYFVEGAGASA